MTLAGKSAKEDPASETRISHLAETLRVRRQTRREIGSSPPLGGPYSGRSAVGCGTDRKVATVTRQQLAGCPIALLLDCPKNVISVRMAGWPDGRMAGWPSL